MILARVNTSTTMRNRLASWPKEVTVSISFLILFSHLISRANTIPSIWHALQQQTPTTGSLINGQTADCVTPECPFFCCFAFREWSLWRVFIFAAPSSNIHNVDEMMTTPSPSEWCSAQCINIKHLLTQRRVTYAMEWIKNMNCLHNGGKRDTLT